MTNGTALLIVDVQNGMFLEADPVFDGDGLLARISGLIEKARASEIPVIYVQHNEGEGQPLETNQPGWRIHPKVAPVGGEFVVQKHTPDSFHETNLQAELERLGVGSVVVAGLQTDMCIDATSHRANELGYQVTVAEDGHSTWEQGGLSAPQIIANYNERFRNFAKIMESSAIAFG